LLEPPWRSPSFPQHLSCWGNVHTVILESPAFIFWPPTRQQYETVKAEITSYLNDCRLEKIFFLCAYGTELDSDIDGVEGRTLEGSIWESESEGVNDFYVPQDGRTVSAGGVYVLLKVEGGVWIDTCYYPAEYNWASDYTSRTQLLSYI